MTLEMNQKENDQQWIALRAEYLQYLRTDKSWLEIWRLFTQNDWYQSQVRYCAKVALKDSGDPQAWLDDITQDAVLLFSRQLRRSADLGYDTDRSEANFPSWLRTILIRLYKEALRGMRRQHTREQNRADFAQEVYRVSQDEKIDLRLAIDRLPPFEKYILHLILDGLSMQEIAGHTGKTYWQVQYARKNGIERLQSYLAADLK